MTASDLSSSLNEAIAAADFGSNLVKWGIALEAIDLIVKCGEHEGFCKWFGDPNRFEAMNLERLKRFSKIFHPWTLAIEIVSFILVVYGLSVEISGSNEAYRISGLQNSSLNSEAATARVIAGNAEKEAALANERAANIESNNLVLRKQLESRQIQQQFAIGKRLKTFSGTDISIICSDSSECKTFVNQLCATLSIAQWHIFAPIITEKYVPDGVTIGLCSTNDSDLPIRAGWKNLSEAKTTLHFAAESLANELKSEGIDEKIDDKILYETSLRFNGVLVFVGGKPTLDESKIIKLENEIWDIGENIETNSSSMTFEQNRKLELQLEDKYVELGKTGDVFEFKGTNIINEHSSGIPKEILP